MVMLRVAMKALQLAQAFTDSAEWRERVRCALAWLEDGRQEPPTPPGDGTADADGVVEDAMRALRFALYGWRRKDRLAAALHFGEAVRDIARGAE